MKHKKVLELFKKDLIKNLDGIVNYKKDIYFLDTFPYKNEIFALKDILKTLHEYEEKSKQASSYTKYFAEAASVFKKNLPSQEDYMEMNLVFDIFHNYSRHIDSCTKFINELSIHQRGLPIYAIEKNMQNAKSELKPVLLLTPTTDNLQDLSKSLNDLENQIIKIEKNYLYSVVQYSGGHWTPGSGHSR